MGFLPTTPITSPSRPAKRSRCPTSTCGSQPPIGPMNTKPLSSIQVTMRPISSMCPASMMVGAPSGLTTAKELPCTSRSTLAANRRASSRQMAAGADSKPEGPGVSSSRRSNASEASENIRRTRDKKVLGRVHSSAPLDKATETYGLDAALGNRARCRRAGGPLRNWRWRGHRARAGLFRAHAAAERHRHVTGCAPAAGRCARCVVVLPQRASRLAHCALGGARSLPWRVCRCADGGGRERPDAAPALRGLPGGGGSESVGGLGFPRQRHRCQREREDERAGKHMLPVAGEEEGHAAKERGELAHRPADDGEGTTLCRGGRSQPQTK